MPERTLVEAPDVVVLYPTRFQPLDRLTDVEGVVPDEVSVLADVILIQ